MTDYYKMSDSKQFQDLFPEMYPEAINRNDLSTMTTKNVTFVTTESCNLACTYCYQCDKNNTRYMSKEVAKTAVENMFNKTKMKKYLNEDLHKCVILEFIGGEPFLNVDVMDFVVDYFRYLAHKNNSVWANNYMINVTTNGTLNHTEKVKKFIEKNKERLSVSITIDGNKELHDACRVFHDGTGSYDVVYRNVKEAIELFGLNATKVTFAPENIDKINTAIPHLFSIGLTNINANCVFEDVWKPEHSQIFYKELLQLADYMLENKIYKTGYCSIFDETIGQPIPETENKNWCGGDGQMLAIGTDGTIYPCIRYMKYSLSNKNRKEIVIGNVNDGLIDKKENPLFEEMCGITRRSQSTDECFYCPVGSGCSW